MTEEPAIANLDPHAFQRTRNADSCSVSPLEAAANHASRLTPLQAENLARQVVFGIPPAMRSVECKQPAALRVDRQDLPIAIQNQPPPQGIESSNLLQEPAASLVFRQAGVQSAFPFR